MILIMPKKDDDNNIDENCKNGVHLRLDVTNYNLSNETFYLSKNEDGSYDVDEREIVNGDHHIQDIECRDCHKDLKEWYTNLPNDKALEIDKMVDI